ncbi:hypothetical protein D3C80_1885720 [compost metagenome]
MFFRQLVFVAVALLFSGTLLISVDTKIYAVSQMRREKKYARIFGWVCLSLFLADVIVLVLYH